MAMKPQCIAAVSQAAGRKLTPSEIQGIEDRLSAAMRRLARDDPQGWMAKPYDQQVLEGSQLAMQEMQAEARRKLQNAQRQIVATAATEQRVKDLQTNLSSGRSSALVEDINNTNLYADGIKRQAMSQLMDLVEATASRQDASLGRRALMFLFDAQNPQMTSDLIAEIFAKGQGNTGNQLAQAGAKAWLGTIENLRQRFNAAGGDVGRLDYGYMPQAHDSARVRAAGMDEWAGKTLPLLDRSRYLRADGSRMNDGEVLDFLRAAWGTISTDGLNKLVPGQFQGSGARANNRADSRQIHFADGQAYLSYNEQFGMGTMYDAMRGHVGGMARDIGLVERYGPNPNAQFKLQNDLAKLADGGLKRVAGNFPQAYWDIVTGVTGSPESARLAQVSQDIRNIQTAGKLAGAVISSITDLGTIITTTGYNKLPYWDLLRNIARAGSAEAKEFANTHGMIAESMMSDLNRFAGENIRHNWSGALANSTMKLSFMNWWTDTLRRGFSMTMMQGLGRLSETRWVDLTEWDRSHLGRKGITEADWDVVNQAQLTDYRGAKMLTPEAIAAGGNPRANEVTGKILGFITDESEYAVMNPDLATKAIQTWGGKQTGTGLGELARLVMQFKSFPIAMITRHWRRMLEGDRGLDGAPLAANRLAYASAMALTSVALGAIAFQTKQIIAGKDPVDMTKPKFWTRAAAQGGGLGFVGDILLGDTTEDRSPLDTTGRALLGPSFGSLSELVELTKGNYDEWAADKETHAGAEALRFARSHLPYVNLWYARAAMDHAFMQDVQENLSPGYMGRIRQKAYKDWEQGFWWEPGETAPSRAPNFEAIGGR